MIIDKILRQLTPERVKKEIEAIQRVKLPPELQKWVREYEKVGERNEFFWKFMYKANQLINPFNIPQKSISEVKFLIIMFVILLDDISDKIKDEKLFAKLINIPFGQNSIEFTRSSRKEKKYLQFAMRLWYYIERRIKKYPSYKKFREIFNFDFVQTLNALKYSLIVNRIPYLINKTEYWMYSPHTLLGMVYCDLDLMNFSKFNIKDLSIIREVFLRAQKMARIGDCLSTWIRELNENDLTSGVLAYAINSNLVKVEDMRKKNKRNYLIIKINRSAIRKELVKKWQQYHGEMSCLCRRTRIKNLKSFLPQLEKLILMHFISEGYK